MAGSLEVTRGQLVRWRMNRPLAWEKIESPLFSFLDEEWSLAIDFRFGECCLILKKVSLRRDFHPFEVTIWFEDEGEPTSHLNSVQETILGENQYIWSLADFKLRKEMSEHQEDNRFAFVCLLHVADKEAENRTIRTSSEFTAELEGLSADLGNLLEEGPMRDVELKCGGIIFSAHRVILGSRCRAFSYMLLNETVETVTVNLTSDPDVGELFLKYVYCGRLPNLCCQYLLRELYRVAHDYRVLGLKKACSDCIARGLTEENFIGSLKFAEEYSDEYLKDLIVDFVTGNQRLFHGETWSRFLAEEPTTANEFFQKCVAKWFPK